MVSIAQQPIQFAWSHLALSAVQGGCTIASPVPRFKERIFMDSWWPPVIWTAGPQGADRVKVARVLSTFMKRSMLPGLSERMASGNTLLIA